MKDKKTASIKHGVYVKSDDGKYMVLAICNDLKAANSEYQAFKIKSGLNVVIVNLDTLEEV